MRLFIFRLFTIYMYVGVGDSFSLYETFGKLAMFSDLNDFLDTDVGYLPQGQCIVIVEISGSNGSFVLHHLLSLALRGDTAVCFVGLAQTFHHYAYVGNKLTLNLARMRDSGKLVFVEGLNTIGRNIVKSSVPDQAGNE